MVVIEKNADQHFLVNVCHVKSGMTNCAASASSFTGISAKRQNPWERECDICSYVLMVRSYKKAMILSSCVI